MFKHFSFLVIMNVSTILGLMNRRKISTNRCSNLENNNIIKIMFFMIIYKRGFHRRIKSNALIHKKCISKFGDFNFAILYNNIIFHKEY